MPTQHYALFGDPIARSPSPAMHNAAFATLGLDAIYALRPTPAEAADGVVGQVRDELAGANITTPLKTLVARSVPLVGAAARAGAVNTLWWRQGELVGSLTDVCGVADPLRQRRRAGDAGLVIGSGGAARAAALALELLGLTVLVAARSAAKAQALLDTLALDRSNPCGQAVALGDGAGLTRVWREAAVVIQATPVGSYGNDQPLPQPLPWSAGPRGAVAFEMVTVPRQTSFLKAAASHGYQTIEGWEMLVAQGAEAFRLWTQQEPPIEVMRDAVLALGPEADTGADPETRPTG